VHRAYEPGESHENMRKAMNQRME